MASELPSSGSIRKLCLLKVLAVKSEPLFFLPKNLCKTLKINELIFGKLKNYV